MRTLAVVVVIVIVALVLMRKNQTSAPSGSAGSGSGSQTVNPVNNPGSVVLPFNPQPKPTIVVVPGFQDYQNNSNSATNLTAYHQSVTVN